MRDMTSLELLRNRAGRVSRLQQNDLIMSRICPENRPGSSSSYTQNALKIFNPNFASDILGILHTLLLANCLGIPNISETRLNLNYYYFSRSYLYFPRFRSVPVHEVKVIFLYPGYLCFKLLIPLCICVAIVNVKLVVKYISLSLSLSLSLPLIVSSTSQGSPKNDTKRTCRATEKKEGEDWVRLALSVSASNDVW